MAQNFNFHKWNYKDTKKSSDKTVEPFKPPTIGGIKVGIENIKSNPEKVSSVINKPDNYLKKERPDLKSFHQEVLKNNNIINDIINFIPSHASLIAVPLRDVMSNSDITIQYNNAEVEVKNIILSQQVLNNITSNTRILFFNEEVMKNSDFINQFSGVTNLSASHVNNTNFITNVNASLVNFNNTEIDKGKTIVSDSISEINIFNSNIDDFNPTELTSRSIVLQPEFNTNDFKSPVEIMDPVLDIIDTGIEPIISTTIPFNLGASSKTSEFDNNGNIVNSLTDSSTEYGPNLYLYSSLFGILYGRMLSFLPGPIAGSAVNIIKEVGADKFGARIRNLINWPLIHALYMRNQLVKNLSTAGVFRKFKVLFSAAYYKDSIAESLATFSNEWLVEKDIDFEGWLAYGILPVPGESMDVHKTFFKAYPPVRYGTSTTHRAGEISHNIRSKKMSVFQLNTYMLTMGGVNERYGPGSLIDKSKLFSYSTDISEFNQKHIFYGMDSFWQGNEYIKEYNTEAQSFLYYNVADRNSSMPGPTFRNLKQVFSDYQNGFQTVLFTLGVKGSGKSLKLPESFVITGDKLTGSYAALDFVGRHDPVYRYTKFVRMLSVKFDIIADVPTHNIMNHHILNELNKFVLPKYSGSRTNVLMLTLGDYMEDQDCLLNDINITPINELDWATQLSGYDYSIPKGYTVSLSFTILNPGISTSSDTIGSNALLHKFKLMK